MGLFKHNLQDVVSVDDIVVLGPFDDSALSVDREALRQYLAILSCGFMIDFVAKHSQELADEIHAKLLEYEIVDETRNMSNHTRFDELYEMVEKHVSRKLDLLEDGQYQAGQSSWGWL